MVIGAVRLQDRIIDVMKSGGDDVVGDIMDAVLRSSVVDPAVHMWYLAQLAADGCVEN